MTLKNQLKKVTPQFVFKYRKNRRLKKMSEYNRRRYMAAMNAENLEKYQANLLMHSHVLEKGLSHEKIRYGFGVSQLKESAHSMKNYLQYGNKNDFAYQTICSTLKEYIELHEKVNHSLEYMSSIFSEEQLNDIKECKLANSGYKIVATQQRYESFSSFAMNRHSVREFSSEAIEHQDVFDAIRIAQKSPSACNRQSTRVYVVKDLNIIAKIIQVQGGYNGYELPKIVLVVVADQIAFSDPGDLSMAHIEGGMFNMSLLYALDEKGIGACVLNTAFEEDREKEIRENIKMKDSETFITLMAIGKKQEFSKVCCSPRYDIEDIVTII